MDRHVRFLFCAQAEDSNMSHYINWKEQGLRGKTLEGGIMLSTAATLSTAEGVLVTLEYGSKAQ